MDKETLEKIKNWLAVSYWFPENYGVEVIGIDELEKYLESLIKE